MDRGSIITLVVLLVLTVWVITFGAAITGGLIGTYVVPYIARKLKKKLRATRMCF